MKKILYYIVFICVFFIGSNFVSAFECYYKTDDDKIIMGIDNGTAYLLKGYSGVGSDSAQKKYASWSIKGNCEDNFKLYFKAQKGDNEISYSKLEGKDAFVLNKVSGNSASYEYRTYDSSSQKHVTKKITLKSVDDNLVMFCGDDNTINTSDSYKCEFPDVGTVFYLADPAKYISKVQDGKFPDLYVDTSTPGHYYFYAGAVGTAALNMDIIGPKDTQMGDKFTSVPSLECEYKFDQKTSVKPIYVMLVRTSDSKYYFCVSNSSLDFLGGSAAINLTNGNCASMMGGTVTLRDVLGDVTVTFDSDTYTLDDYFFYQLESESECSHFKDSVYLNEEKSSGSNVKYVISHSPILEPEPNNPDKNYDSTACGIFTQELVDMITDALDLIKIAGPIIALVLGTIDFIKAMTSGDSEKELKTAFTRFSKRLVAAIILFLLPIILAFLLDIFLKGQPGYNPDNPYCGVVDWSN